jgi:hypothetical protein
MLFIKIGAFKEAGEQAYLNKDIEGLRYENIWHVAFYKYLMLFIILFLI